MNRKTLRTFVILTGLILIGGPALALPSRIDAGFVPPPITFVVNETGDAADPYPGDGTCDTAPRLAGLQCSLRAAIQESNTTPMHNKISFNIPGPGVHTISPTSELPEITSPVTIDGYTQPGASPNTLSIGNDAVLRIELSGNPNMHGIVLDTNASTLRGLVVNGFDTGIVVNGAGSKIEGNFIGTKASGKRPRSNVMGITMYGSGNVIGGTQPAARNIISGNQEGGIHLGTYGADEPTDNIVQGNYIGTDKNGSAAVGNGFAGVAIWGDNNLIGGTTIGARNVISDNGIFGILIWEATGNKVQGNYIGTAANGTDPLGNEDYGIQLNATTTASNNLIGGTEQGAANVIAFSGSYGIVVDNYFSVENAIRRNRIFGSGKLGINLGPDLVTPNDAGDSDGGENQYQNFPAIQNALTATNSIVGRLDSKPNTPYAIEFFSSTSCHPSGYGEGEKYLGTIKVTTNGGGTVPFNVVVMKKFNVGESITGTATDPNGNTSEFSKCRKAKP